MRPNLTINLGVRYEYQWRDGRRPAAKPPNAVASVPGLITFRCSPAFHQGLVPHAWASLIRRVPAATTTFRAGFGMSYDKTFDNLGLLENPRS